MDTRSARELIQEQLRRAAEERAICTDGCDTRVLSLSLKEEGTGSIEIVTGCRHCGLNLSAAVQISGSVIDYAYSCFHNDEPFDWAKLNPALCDGCYHEPHRPGCCPHCKCGELPKTADSMKRMQATLDRATNLDAAIVERAVKLVQARIIRADAQDARNALLHEKPCASNPAGPPCFSGLEPEQWCERCRVAQEHLAQFRAAAALVRKHFRLLTRLVEKRAR